MALLDFLAYAATFIVAALLFMGGVRLWLAFEDRPKTDLGKKIKDILENKDKWST